MYRIQERYHRRSVVSVRIFVQLMYNGTKHLTCTGCIMQQKRSHSISSHPHGLWHYTKDLYRQGGVLA